MEMKAQETKLQDAENDLKELMADVTRAMEKAQEAVARIASKAASVITETDSISR
jgi:predicted  nucleic acid-binding Zn-ribbon protein